jgi:uncharacterized protein (DUF427 family)
MRPHLEDIEIGPSSSPSVPYGGFRWESARRRVRAVVDGVTVADSERAMLLLESGHLPVLYFPREDVRQDLLSESERTSESALKGIASYRHLQVGDRRIEDAAWSYLVPSADGPDMAGYIAFYWNKMDAWYEEEERVFAHARDPYKRVDVLPSSKHVQIVLGGQTVVDSRRPQLLIETSLPTRYYVPAEDVRMDLLEATTTQSHCPYKGQASYWTARIGEQVYEDIAWSYPSPLPECLNIKDLICFYNERVDAMIVDGEELPVPITPWSKNRQGGVIPPNE